MSTEALPERSGLGAAVADLVVRVIQEHTGRGPTHAKVIIQGDTIAVVMNDLLSKGERVLVDFGDQEAVLTIRRTFHRAMRKALISGVEQLTGRKVVALMAGHQADPDYASKVFVLGDPLPDGDTTGPAAGDEARAEEDPSHPAA